MTVSEQTTIQTLDFLYQHLLSWFQNRLESICLSTLWVCSSGTTAGSTIQIAETDTEIILNAKLPNVRAESLEIQITQEIILLKGELLVSTGVQNDVEQVFYPRHFHSLIPLPSLVQPQSAIAKCEEDILTLIVQKFSKQFCVSGSKLSPSQSKSKG
jgi:HSP20 family molecular chaperone IbpA